ncbi:ethyl acetate hydrolase-like [Littorina saxatilis]|uniref:Alpha/beta hydrolase fold-3 domain-containing protein n=1 Tax=Littorina saxatilis TaxID=31220 RepID=A0AAN9BER5_9CAEN
MTTNLEALKAKYKVNEESESYLQQRLEKTGKLLDTGACVEEARQAHEEVVLKYAGDVEFQGDIKEFFVPSPSFPGGVPVDVIKPLILTRRPTVLVYFHDGAMIFGSRKTSAPICKLLAREAMCIVINVEYRLAPEAKFPACYDDAKCVVRWVMMNRSLIGAGNDSKVGVAGAGAGGNIAATMAHEIRGLSYQILVYPLVDFRFGQPSVEEFHVLGLKTQEHHTWCTEQFLSTSEEVTNPRVTPLLQPKFTKLPPTLIIVAELDPLRDGCYEYKKIIKEAGIEAESMILKGTIHSFFSQPGHFKETTRRTIEKIVSFMKKHGTS